MASPTGFDPSTLARGADALLREHPDALVAGLASNGLIVPVPQTVGLWGQGLIEGRAVFDNVVAADRNTVARMWVDMRHEGATSGKVRMLRRPKMWMTLHFIDLLEIHGIVLAVLLPSDDQGDEPQETEEVHAAPRFCTLTEDEGARVLDCDDAFTEMFGFDLAEMYGQSVLDQIHPDDQGRAVEGWLTVLSTSRNQQTRLRRKRKDGSWMWVDTTLHNFLNEPGRNHVLVEIIDISAEMHAQEALQDREELLRRLTNAMPVGLLQLDVARNVLYNNSRLLEILHGKNVDATPGAPESAHITARAGVSDPGSLGTDAGEQPCASLEEALATLTEEARADFDAALAEVLADGVDRDVELDVALPHGELRRALFSLRALLRQSGEVSGAITCVLDVTDSARARSELERRATYDMLTGCHNRSSILSALEDELAREDAAGLGVVYVDLDEFKPVNDRLGHAAGDELLVMVAQRLRHASRDSDLVGRLGGDEFLVMLQDVPSDDVAMLVAERICGLLATPFELAGGAVELRGSVGVACSAGEDMSAEELVRRADAAMYESKGHGRGRPVFAA
ncbi:MAG TPA: diguanylate cyclase [Solirubrobacteraceae bacterium]|jgi:diguanylate cyclase (GGDEF)-like protein/PAS domain S-box-containing protein|nr:diguanylate cyclase [Solirubrobacteraceae bacterium]